MYLLTVLKEKNLSKLQLALKAGIAPSDLYCALNGKKPFYPMWKSRISEYLQMNEDELFGEGSNDD